MRLLALPCKGETFGVDQALRSLHGEMLPTFLGDQEGWL